MKKNVIKRLSISAFFIAAVFLAGCTLDEENKTSFELKKDGTITQIIVDDNTIGATGEEIEDYFNSESTEFQQINSYDSVSMENCRASDEKINLEIRYSSVQAYSQFNDVKCFNGSLKDAYNEGYDLNRTFYAKNGAEVPYFMLPYLFPEGKVLIVEEAMNVKVPGSIAAYSTGVSALGSNEVVVEPNYDESVDEIFRTTIITPAFIIYNNSK